MNAEDIEHVTDKWLISKSLQIVHTTQYLKRLIPIKNQAEELNILPHETDRCTTGSRKMLNILITRECGIKSQ